MKIEIKAGKWLVWDSSPYYASRPRFVCSKVIKATDKTVTHAGLYGRETRKFIDGKEVWCGDSERDALSMVDRLNESSKQLVTDEKQARENHDFRVAEIVSGGAIGKINV